MINSIQFVNYISSILRVIFLGISAAGAHCANTGGTFGEKLRMPVAAYFDIHEIGHESRL